MEGYRNWRTIQEMGHACINALFEGYSESSLYPGNKTE